MFVEFSTVAGSLILSFCLILLMYIPGIRTGLNLADEGYLWHGILRVLQGEVPIRDFRAYDPGRYYWYALWMRFLGRDLLSLRISLVASQIIGLAAGISATHIASGNWMTAFLVGLVLAPWMYSRHKQIDVMVTLLAVLFAVMLVDHPTPSQYFLSGVFVGLAFFFGLNHGLYAGGSCLLLCVILAACGRGPSAATSLAWYSLGVSCGMLPMLLMFIAVPGFAKVYWERKISTILKRGTSNLPLPIPWLWRISPAQLKGADLGTGLTTSLAFTAMPIFVAVVFVSFVLAFENVSQQNLSIIAATSVGLFYMHSAMSRADLEHLAQAILPINIAITLYLLELPFGWVGVLGVVVLTFRFIFLKRGPYGSGSSKSEKIELAGTKLWLDQAKAGYVRILCDLIGQHTKPGDSALILPVLVTLYPLMDRRPAVYDIFCVYPAGDDEQLRMIAQLEETDTRFALINNVAVDGRDELRFSNTHNLVWDYLRENFRALDIGRRLAHNHVAYIRCPKEFSRPVQCIAEEPRG